MGSEVIENISYLFAHKKVDDKIYVYRGSIPVFMYETQYPYGAAKNYDMNMEKF